MRRTLASMIFGVLISMGIVACTNASTAIQEAATQPARLTVPSGTYMTVELQDGISTEQSSPGDPFIGNLSKDVVVDGLTAFVKGSIVHGRVLEVQEPGRVKGLAQLKLELTSVEHNGKDVPIQTQTYVGIGHHAKKRDAEVVDTKIREIADGGTVLATQGSQLRYPPETRLLFTLASPVEI